jgi:hypothetical protein
MTLQLKTPPSLLVLMGSLDWLTTIIGIVYFGAIESNPFLAGLTQTNLPAFTGIKLGVAFFVGLLFYQANKILDRTVEQNNNATKRARLLLKTAYVASLIFLLFAVLNNVWTLVSRA